MHTKHDIHMLIMLTYMICMLMCTLVHITDVLATLQNFVMMVKYSNFASKYVCVRKDTNSHGPKKVLVLRFTPIVFDEGVGSLEM